MLTQQALKKSITTVTVLTSLSILFQIGALAYQAISNMIGIGSTQLVYSTCNDVINAILSNNNLFYLVALAASAVSIILLITMLVILIRGLCSWRKFNEQKYIDGGQITRQVNNEVTQTNPNTQNLPTDEYFTYCKMIVGSVLYGVAFVAILGHFALFLCILVSFIICGGVAFISLIVISGLSFLSFIFTLVSFIIWQIQRCKIKELQSTDKPNEDQNQNQNQNQNQKLIQNKNQEKNEQAGQINKMDTLYPLNMQNQDERQQKQNYNDYRNEQDSSNKLKIMRNPTTEQYVSFNGQNAPLNQNNERNKQNRENIKQNTTNMRNSQKNRPTLLQSQEMSKSSKAPTPKFVLSQHQDLLSNNDGRKNIQIRSQRQKQPLQQQKQRQRQREKPIQKQLSQSNFKQSQKINLIKQPNKQNQKQNLKERKKQKSKEKLKENQKQKQKQTFKQKNKNEQNNKQVYPEKIDYNSPVKSNNQQQLFLKENRKQILRNNGGYPFFKSPPKSREPFAFNHRSPLQKYEKQYDDRYNNTNPNQNQNQNNNTNTNTNTNNKNTNANTNSNSNNTNKNTNPNIISRPNQNIQSNSKPVFKTKQQQTQTYRKNSRNIQSGTSRDYQRNSEEKQSRIDKSQDEKNKKARKSGLLVDYIRSKYTD